MPKVEHGKCHLQKSWTLLTSGGEIPALWRATKSCWGQMRGHLLERSLQAYLASLFSVRDNDGHMQMPAESSQRAALSLMGPGRASEQEAP